MLQTEARGHISHPSCRLRRPSGSRITTAAEHFPARNLILRGILESEQITAIRKMGLWMRAPHNRHTRAGLLGRGAGLLMGCAWPPCTQASDDGSLQLKSQEATETRRNRESNSSPWDEALKHSANGKKKLKGCVSEQMSHRTLGWFCSLCSVLGFLRPPCHCFRKAT